MASILNNTQKHKAVQNEHRLSSETGKTNRKIASLLQEHVEEIQVKQNGKLKATLTEV